ncbi:SRPBCC family protein [Prosthecobacter sp.]|uniref:SRPBCC family protein n=1 Tax=Prosthecobacter sp. TaxID=1965333 RepID=UPI001DB9C436|nr:SRPBCC family protein [Prosthecobacter sp.]MCB1277830.1 SRPBCC family protein [Prosthecobacter sp.]
MSAPPAANEILSSRVFPFSRERVFEAFSDPQQLTLWFGPNGFTSTFETFEFNPGGEWKFVFHGPNGANYPNHITFADIVPLERIVYDHVAPHFRMTMTFVDENGGTRLTWRMAFATTALSEQLKPVCVPANQENFDRLAAHLTSNPSHP